MAAWVSQTSYALCVCPLLVYECPFGYILEGRVQGKGSFHHDADLTLPEIDFFLFKDFVFFPFSPWNPLVYTCIFLVVGPFSCGMWDAASAWLDEGCHVRAQDPKRRNPGRPKRSTRTQSPGHGPAPNCHGFDSTVKLKEGAACGQVAPVSRETSPPGGAGCELLLYEGAGIEGEKGGGGRGRDWMCLQQGLRGRASVRPHFSNCYPACHLI